MSQEINEPIGPCGLVEVVEVEVDDGAGVVYVGAVTGDGVIVKVDFGLGSPSRSMETAGTSTDQPPRSRVAVSIAIPGTEMVGISNETTGTSIEISPIAKVVVSIATPGIVRVGKSSEIAGTSIEVPPISIVDVWIAIPGIDGKLKPGVV